MFHKYPHVFLAGSIMKFSFFWSKLAVGERIDWRLRSRWRRDLEPELETPRFSSNVSLAPSSPDFILQNSVSGDWVALYSLFRLSVPHRYLFLPSLCWKVHFLPNEELQQSLQLSTGRAKIHLPICLMLEAKRNQLYASSKRGEAWTNLCHFTDFRFRRPL